MKNKVISLLSEGLDSPVANYLIIKKEFLPIFITFITTKTQENLMRDKVIEIIEKLSENIKNNLKLYLIPHTDNLDNMKKSCSRKLTCVLCKRLMLRITKRIADKENTNLILTGDILGEQASQTIGNLFAYNYLMKEYVKLSPLIGFNKMEVVDISKKVGLFEICSRKLQACQYFPQYPETNAKLSEVQSAEEKIDIENLVSNSIKKAEILKI